MSLWEAQGRHGVVRRRAPRWIDADDSRGEENRAVLGEAGVVFKGCRQRVKSNENVVIISMTIFWAGPGVGKLKLCL